MYYGKGSKEEIMNYIGTVLNTIITPKIKFVEYQKIYDSGMTKNRCPGCNVNDVRIDKTKILKDIVRNTFQVGIVGYVYAGSGEVLSTVLNTFMEAVKDKVVLDPTCGNEAYDSRTILIETDAGSRHPQGMFVQMLEIIYFSDE